MSKEPSFIHDINVPVWIAPSKNRVTIKPAKLVHDAIHMVTMPQNLLRKAFCMRCYYAMGHLNIAAYKVSSDSQYDATHFRSTMLEGMSKRK